MPFIFGERLTEEQEQTRAGWKYRCLKAAGEHSPWHFAMLVYALGGETKSPPRFQEGPTVDENGMMSAPILGRDGLVRHARLCTTEQYQSDFRRIADEVKLDDDERRELFDVLRGWIKIDKRVTVQL